VTTTGDVPPSTPPVVASPLVARETCALISGELEAAAAC
jgi:hypothetical protein